MLRKFNENFRSEWTYCWDNFKFQSLFLLDFRSPFPLDSSSLDLNLRKSKFRTEKANFWYFKITRNWYFDESQKNAIAKKEIRHFFTQFPTLKHLSSTHITFLPFSQHFPEMNALPVYCEIEGDIEHILERAKSDLIIQFPWLEN